MTGATPASAASCSSVANRVRSSPSSARIWAAFTDPLRGSDWTRARSGCCARAAVMVAERCWIWATSGLRTATSARTTSPLASPLGLARVRGRGRAQAFEELGRRAPARVGVLGEEARQTPLAQPFGALGGGIATEEGQGDGRVDVGEDRRGSRPEALEQGAELIGERHALGDQVVAAPHEGAEGARVIRQGLERAEAVSVSAEEIGEDEGVARVTLAPRRRVAGPAGLESVGVNGDDRVQRPSGRRR